MTLSAFINRPNIVENNNNSEDIQESQAQTVPPTAELEKLKTALTALLQMTKNNNQIGINKPIEPLNDISSNVSDLLGQLNNVKRV